MAEGKEDDDKDSKTEEATPHKLMKLREKNVVPLSKDFGVSVELFLGVLISIWFVPYAAQSLGQAIKTFMTVAFNKTPLTVVDWHPLFARATFVLAENIWPFLVLVVVVAVLVTTVQTQGLLWSAEALEPKVERLNPVEGIKKLFSRKRLIDVLKNILKLVILVTVTTYILKDSFVQLGALSALPIGSGMIILGKFITALVLGFALALLAIGIVDLWYQRFEFMIEHRMTKQELKEEIKEREGDPQIKGKVRSLMRAANNKKMLSAVPKATALVVNPNHYAIAIEYGDGLAAPKVIAKGVDYLALRMKRLAKNLDIPVIENKPLARMLYKTTRVGGFIPRDLYQAVADVLAMVYRMKGRWGWNRS